jgi:hypothetical protein
VPAYERICRTRRTNQPSFRYEAGTSTPGPDRGHWGEWDQAGTDCRPRTSFPGRASVGTPFSAITAPATIVAT